MPRTCQSADTITGRGMPQAGIKPSHLTKLLFAKLNRRARMNETSTWGQDCERGLAHPDSVSERRGRIVAHDEWMVRRDANFNQALHLLRGSIETREQLIVLLHVAGSTLAGQEKPLSAEIEESIEIIDGATDKLENQS